MLVSPWRCQLGCGFPHVVRPDHVSSTPRRAPNASTELVPAAFGIAIVRAAYAMHRKTYMDLSKNTG